MAGKKDKDKPSRSKKSSPKKGAAGLKVFVIGLLFGCAFQFIPAVKQVSEELISYINSRQWQPPPPSCHPHLPSASLVFDRAGHTIAYEGRTRTALWVYEELTAESLQGSIQRTECSFAPDPDLPASIRADLSDYRGSGFDRGHLAPAADHHASLEAMQAAAYLSNISPQIAEFNRGYWKELEKSVRALTKQYSCVRVVTGPLYLPQQAADGKYYVTYQVIGKNNVAVPTHFFKVISVGQGKPLMAYILPNAPLEKDLSLESFRTTVEKIERASGILFHNFY